MVRNYQVSALAFIVLAVPLLFAHTNGFNLTDYISYRGFSAIELVVQHAHRENFRDDFPSGVAATKASISSVAYLWSGVDTPEDAMVLHYVMITLDIAFSLAGALYLFYTLVRFFDGELGRQSFDLRVVTAAVITGLFMSASYGQYCDLARFATPFYHGQFYGFADGARLFAIALAIQGRWAMVVVALGVSFLFHPVKAVWAALFLTPAAIVSIRDIMKPKPLLAGIATAAVCLTWFLTARPDAPTNTDIDAQTYFLLSRAMQYHWYPFDLGVLDRQAHRYLLPFCAAMLVALIAGTRLELSRHATRVLLYGMVTVLVVTAIGIVMSTFVLPPVIARLSPVRASTLAIAVAVIVTCAGATRMLLSGRYLEAALASGFLAGAFVDLDGLSETFALALACVYLWRGRGNISNTWRLVALLAIVNAGLLLWQLVSGRPIEAFVSRWAFVPLLVAGFFALANHFVLRWRKVTEAVALGTIALFTVAGAFYWGPAARHFKPKLAARAADYHGVQMWARNTTPVDALFIVDPCLTYGWREFSMRGSIGTPTEWYMNGWMYALDEDVFKRGQKIGKTIGFTIDDYLSPASGPRKFHRRHICRAVQKLVYDPDSGALERLAAEHGVDYFVATSDGARNLRDTRSEGIVMANKSFTVFRLSGALPGDATHTSTDADR